MRKDTLDRLKTVQVEALKKDSFFLAKETKASLKHLVDLTNLGYFTNDSQEGMYKPGKLIERAYVTGFMPNKLAHRFVDHFLSTTDCICVLPQEKTDNPNSFPVTLQEKSVMDRLNPGMAKGRPPVEIGGTTYVPYSYIHMTTWSSKSDLLGQMVNISMDPKDWTVVYCMDPVWKRKAAGKDGLYRKIVASLKAV